MPGNICHKDRSSARRNSDIIIKIARKLRAGKVLRKHRKVAHSPTRRRQHSLLKSPRIGKFRLHTLQMLPILIVQRLPLETPVYQADKHPPVEWLLNEIER